MPTTVAFQEHETFHKAFLRMGAAGLVSSLVCHALGASLGSGVVSAPWRLAAVGAAVLAAGIWPHLRSATRAQAAFAGILLALAIVFVATGAAALPLALTGAAGLGAAVSLWGLRGRRLAIGLALGTPAVAIAAAVFARLGNASALAALPGPAVAAIAGLGFASVAVLTQLPRHLLLASDRVGAAHRKLVGAEGEVALLANRGLELWRRTEGTLPPNDANRELLEEAVLRLLDVGTRWASVEAESARTAPEGLSKRILELDERMDAAKDPVVKEQYQSAKDALVEQLRYLRDIESSRERVLARMHNYLAAMERLNLALVNVKSTSASKNAVDVQPMVEALTDLGRDIDAMGEVLDG